MDWSSAIIASVVGALVGSTVGPFVAGIIQGKREDITYNRQLATAQHELLSKKYDELMLAARKYLDKAHYLAYKVSRDAPGVIITWESLLEAANDERIEFQRAYTMVMLHGGANDVSNLSEQFTEAYVEGAAKLTDTEMAYEERFGFRDFKKAYDALLEALQTHIRKLGNPM